MIRIPLGAASETAAGEAPGAAADAGGRAWRDRATHPQHGRMALLKSESRRPQGLLW